MDKKFNKAFTLAEILVVIGLIGVVSVLTVPALSRNTNKTENITKLQKTYQTLQEAYSRASAKYGPITTWFSEDITKEAQAEKMATRFGEFLRIERNCGFDKGCFPTTKVKDFRGNTLNYSLDDVQKQKILLFDNVALVFETPFNTSGVSYSNEKFYGYIYADINGTKGDAIVAENTFMFVVTEKGVRPNGMYDPEDCFSTPLLCTAWVIRYGNMDYQQADTSGVCKNGTQLSKTNVSCS